MDVVVVLLNFVAWVVGCCCVCYYSTHVFATVAVGVFESFYLLMCCWRCCC